ncbi:serine/threonine-protein kinase [Streptomyces flavovirens]|uniref:serine/threonine-protein kinase n=1 Tax=Streptomyces flavovirens TaxID=52258 RepID=UPI0031E50247
MKVPQWSVRPPTRPEFRLTTRVLADRYRLGDVLGRGGAADVYEGLDLRMRRPVAIKVVRPESGLRTEERFHDEGRLLAQLQHPGLVAVYDSGEEDGCPYLVMQLIKGATLRRRIAAARMTPAEVGRAGAALASALAHVHAAGVVHRDVKPSNILMDETGRPHLTDFGISKLLDAAARTATGPLVGTAAYLAPEQVRGRGAGAGLGRLQPRSGADRVPQRGDGVRGSAAGIRHSAAAPPSSRTAPPLSGPDRFCCTP